MSVDELVRHDDYEFFASYLGVDYDDYVELVGDFELSDDEIEIEYALSIQFQLGMGLPMGRKPDYRNPTDKVTHLFPLLLLLCLLVL